MTKFCNSNVNLQRRNNLVIANMIASRLKNNSKVPLEKSRINQVKKTLKKNLKTMKFDYRFSKEFLIGEFDLAISDMKKLPV